MKTPTIEEIDAALEEAFCHRPMFTDTDLDVIRFLAKLAKVVMGEPSDKCMMEFINGCFSLAEHSDDIIKARNGYKAMIEQAIEEAQDERIEHPCDKSFATSEQLASALGAGDDAGKIGRELDSIVRRGSIKVVEIKEAQDETQ